MIKIHDNKVPFHAMEHIYNFVLNSNFHVSGWKDRDYINKHDIHSIWTKEDLKNAKLYIKQYKFKQKCFTHVSKQDKCNFFCTC